MDTIINYIETMFNKLPNTSEVARLKQDVTDNMEEKYHELLANGASEHAAIGQVIADFGNVEELMDAIEPDIKMEKGMQQRSEKTQTNKVLSAQQVNEFIENKKNSTFIIALGVMICILAFASLVFVSTINENIAILPPVIAVAIAVGIFIYGDTINKKVSIGKGPYDFTLDAESIIIGYQDTVQKERLKFIVGVIMCILSPLVLIIPTSVLEMTDNQMSVLLSFVLVIVSMAVFLIIVGNGPVDNLKRFRSEGNYDPLEQKATSVMEKVASMYWIVVVASYVIYGLITNKWGLASVYFPVVAVLFFVIAVIVNVLYKKENK